MGIVCLGSGFLTDASVQKATGGGGSGDGEGGGGGGGGNTPPLLSVQMALRGDIGTSLDELHNMDFRIFQLLNKIPKDQGRKLGYIDPSLNAGGFLQRTELVGTVSGLIPAGDSVKMFQKVSNIAIEEHSDGTPAVVYVLNSNAPDGPDDPAQRPVPNNGKIFMIDAPGADAGTFYAANVSTLDFRFNFISNVTQTSNSATLNPDFFWKVRYFLETVSLPPPQMGRKLFFGPNSFLAFGTGSDADPRIPALTPP